MDIHCLSDMAAVASCAFSGLILVPRRRSSEQAQLPPGSPALHLLWQPIAASPVQPPQHVAPQRWLILSTRPCGLEQLCSRVDIPVQAVNVVCGPAPHAVVDGGAELAASSEAELQLVLGRAQADHCFLVQQSAAGMPAALEQSTAAAASLLWAFRAYRRSGLRARLSLVTWGAHAVGPHEATAVPASHMAIGAHTFCLPPMTLLTPAVLVTQVG